MPLDRGVEGGVARHQGAGGDDVGLLAPAAGAQPRGHRLELGARGRQCSARALELAPPPLDGNGARLGSRGREHARPPRRQARRAGQARQPLLGHQPGRPTARPRARTIRAVEVAPGS